MAFAYTKLMQAMVAAGVVTDPYFNLVTLLLPGNGTNGAQNNTFLDSSSNNFTITRNGNTTQGTFSPFSQTGWSNYFNAAYLSAGTSSDFSFAGNFTIEMWYYSTITTDQSLILMGSSPYFAINVQAGTGYSIYLNNATPSFSPNNIVPQANTWNHVALVRSGSTVTVYHNGTALSTTATNSSTLGYSGNAFNIGWSNANVYISNLRVVNGTAVYTSNFTPSTTPLTDVTNTKLLTCQSNRFVDTNTQVTAKTITVASGTPSVQAFSPFAPTAAYSASTNGGSGYFDGNGDYLTVANNTALQVGSGDFTIEGWYYPTNSPSQADIFTKYSSGSQEWGVIDSSSSLGFYAGTGGASWTLSPLTFGTVKVNQWNHFAVCRSGNTFSTFLNGTRGATTTNSFTIGATTISVGIGSGNGFSGNFVNGYVSNYRIVKGTAVYDVSQTSITVPTAPFTNITNTSLLTNFTNAGITDATAKNDLETVGNASISTTQSKFGGSSMYFDGTGDYLQIPNNQYFSLNTTNYTIEFWVYLNTVTGQQVFVERFAGGSGPGWTLYINGTTVGYYGSSSVFDAGTLAANQWYHIAVTRSGSTTYFFIDGVLITSTANNITDYSGPLYVGARNGSSIYLNGYIDDLRITKGYARYTANFTPPTAAFPLS